MMLRVANLHVGYGSINAVRGIDLQMNQGELVCLIGANGAGKTTTLKALAGMLLPTQGSITLWDQPITTLASHQRVQHGIALAPEGRGIFARLSVRENLLLGAYLRDDHHAVELDLQQMYALFPRLSERTRQIAGTLSGGEQQMLAIARALMSRPSLLLLDEPSMGLAPIMVQKIFTTIRAIAAQGMTILLVEQNAKLALQISQRAYVMENGRITLSGVAAALLANPQVQQAYLGG
ncbi:MAG: ABC transporter ATP-binding protein [Gammaproteobacteria bacterium]|nr:ABC transporter ATP-binding protein [Gammaproteobacteria bacterium]